MSLGNKSYFDLKYNFLEKNGCIIFPVDEYL